MAKGVLALSRSLKAQSPFLLGLLAGGLGLLSIYELALVLSGLTACSCPWDPAVGIVVWPVVAGSVLGIAGGAFYLMNRTAGGAVLLAGGLIVSSSTFFEMLFLFGPLFFYLAPNLFFGLLLCLGGLLAFPRTRHLLKMLHERGWIP